MSDETTGIALYDRTARDAAAVVISAYSTSFGLAARLLGSRVRPHVRNIYALVRVADEIVDGSAAQAGLSAAAQRRVLDALETDTLTAVDEGFSANLIVHAFARTARECGIGADLVRPFFASMRTDLDVTAHDAMSHDSYVYGSAEVVGLMCLQTFVNAGAARPQPAHPDLVDGARRLGAAFQDVNFLRDLPHDVGSLGRDYLGVGTVETGTGSDETSSVSRVEVLDRIDADLDAAGAIIPRLPADCRRAVTAAHDLFTALSRRLRRAGSTTERVRVPNTVKLGLAARATVGAAPLRAGS